MQKVSTNNLPLIVDLDGTILAGDMLYESCLEFLKSSGFLAPFAFIQILFTLITQGRVGVKRFLANRVSINIEDLLYRDEVIDYVNQIRESGSKTYPVSASDEIFVRKIANFLGCFDEGVGSDGKLNLIGKNKAQYLVDRFGEKSFTYIGDSKADLHVWEKAFSGVVLGSKSLLSKAEKLTQIERFFPIDRNSLLVILKGIRVHQWVKNLLLFVPIIGAHKLLEIGRLSHVAVAFFSFSLIASGVYLTNDLLDISSDRRHPKKKKRPIAAGNLSLPLVFMLAPVLTICGFMLGALVSKSFVSVLFYYFALTVAYSFYLKKIPLLDIILLASLYTIRIVAGTYAADVNISKWLIAFSMFLFFSLACVKRFSELQLMRSLSREKAEGRGYRSSDMEQVGQFGTISGYISILVSALYITSTEVQTLYHSPETLWLLCPILFYWISRVWLLASRGEMHEDPIVFALRDKTSYFVGFLSLIVVMLAAI